MPPLRERRDEIPRLAHALLGKLGGDREIPARTMALLTSHAWPGNVRELRNVVERMVALPDLPPDAWLGGYADEPAPAIDAALGFHEAKERCVEAFERAYLVALLDTHGGNVSEAARVAGLSRQSCYRLMHKHGLADRSS
jgi:DNA-binding NtrC family response regulator